MAKAAKPGLLRIHSDKPNDTFPAEMRNLILKAAEGQGLPSWHIELSIRNVNGKELPGGKVRFKHNFPDGMRESIRDILGSDDWCLQMSLRDGDGDATHANGDDDGTARGFVSGTAGGAPSAAKASAASSPKAKHAAKKTAARPASRPAKKSARKTSKKGNK